MKASTFLKLKINRLPTAFTIANMALLCLSILMPCVSALADEDEPGTPGAPYANMPSLAPLGVRIGKHLEIPESAKGPAIEPGKGYRIQKLGEGLYMITDNGYQSMFMVYETGVVVIDAPPFYAQYIPKGIAEVTDKPITHL